MSVIIITFANPVHKVVNRRKDALGLAGYAQALFV
jgi:hypothetical protein